MLSYFLQRIFALVPVCLGVLTVVCFLIHVVPGDPADQILGEYATHQEKKDLRRELGLDKPVYDQLLGYLGGVIRGDLGSSLLYRRPVSELILERYGATLELALLSMFLAAAIGVPLGVMGAVYRGTLRDFLAMAFALLGVAIPNFWLGPLLILFFSVYLGIFPVSERGDLSSYVLPSFTLGTSLAAFLSRITRSSVLEHCSEDYVRTAKAKGSSAAVVIYKHVLRNAALPIVTVFGLQFGVLLTGAIVTEKIFDWPGLGSLMLEGLGNRDYPVVQGCVLIFSMTYLIVNLITDIVTTRLDPRINLGYK